jgi:hypothetical protein
METNRIRNKSSIQVMMWDKMCIHNIPWNSTTMVPYWWEMLMFGGISKYHGFFVKGQSKWDNIKILILSFGMHT